MASRWLATTWEQLAATVPLLEDRSYVTISWSAVPTVYVQLEQNAAETVALTGADDMLAADRQVGPAGRADRQVGPAGWASLGARGWVVPEADPTGRRTWRTSVPWPSRRAENERLAARCVDVFRRLHAVPGPDSLEYRAWRDPESPPEHVTYWEEALEPGEPHVVLSHLGLRDAQQSDLTADGRA